MNRKFLYIAAICIFKLTTAAAAVECTNAVGHLEIQNNSSYNLYFTRGGANDVTHLTESSIVPNALPPGKTFISHFCVNSKHWTRPDNNWVIGYDISTSSANGPWTYHIQMGAPKTMLPPFSAVTCTGDTNSGFTVGAGFKNNPLLIGLSTCNLTLVTTKSGNGNAIATLVVANAYSGQK